MKVLYIVRGLSGSGKTTLANKLCPLVYSADDWFYDNKGNYNFDPSQLADAHADCFTNVECAMLDGSEEENDALAVANTFSQSWEVEPYFKLAKKYDYSPFVVECQNTFKNVHGVPQETIEAMKNRWEDINT
jgi:predicted kinase